MMAAEEAKRRGLGRGLSALLGDESEDYAALDKVRATKTVPIEYLQPNPAQPRKRFDDDAIDGLVESIREKGVLQPILVRRHPDKANVYEIVAGERRWRASQRAQLHEVPVIIKELSDKDALEIALIENIHREDLTPLEEAEGYQRLMDDFEYTQDALARGIGKSRSHIANMLRLLTLPEEIKSMIDDGLLSAGHGRALIGVPHAETLAHEIVKKGLNVRQAEKLAQQGKGKSAGSDMGKLRTAIESAGGSAGKDPNVAALEASLSDTLGLKVSVDVKGEKGRISIAFDSLDQLDEVISRLNAESGTASAGRSNDNVVEM